MLSGISIVCFTTSYLVVLGLELTRLFFRLPVRLVVMVGFTLAGLFTHTAFLWMRAAHVSAGGSPLSNWYDWYLVAAWVLAVVYLGLAIARPTTTVGIFMLPVILALIGIGYAFRDVAPFPRDRALQLWGIAHGVMLLLGTVAVSFGFVAGVMYLVQSWRLKHHALPQRGLKLPSLEWLQAVNKQSLIYSSCFIALGLIAGIVLNAIESRSAGQAVPWTDGVVISSAVLLVWLLAATLFEWLYKPAQQGRKVAYLTVASFLFLAFVMAILLGGGSQHAKPRNAASSEFGPQPEGRA
jgi:ABC-type transport system involved in cytochrome c biogenesis permease subunit